MEMAVAGCRVQRPSSSAFLDLTPVRVRTTIWCRSAMKPYTDHAILTDGAVYDNLGLETD
jgi:hypothetical protein